MTAVDVVFWSSLSFPCSPGFFSPAGSGSRHSTASKQWFNLQLQFFVLFFNVLKEQNIGLDIHYKHRVSLSLYYTIWNTKIFYKIKQNNKTLNKIY